MLAADRPAAAHEIARCCQAVARLLEARKRLDLTDQRRRAIARRVVALCDQLQQSCSC